MAATQHTPPLLLSRQEKSQFFQQLDAVIGEGDRSHTEVSPGECAAEVNKQPTVDAMAATHAHAHAHAQLPTLAVATATVAPTRAAASSSSNNNERVGASEPEVIVLDSDSESEQAPPAARTDHEHTLHRKRALTSTDTPDSRHHNNNRKAPRRGEPSLQQQCSTLTAKHHGPSSHAALHGRNVLIVPIGADVSHKRVAIWHGMVQKLGGRVVTVECSADRPHQHQSHQPQQRRSTNSRSAATPVRVDWDAVDIVIASAELERERARAFFQTDALPPTDHADHVQVFTPEWLASAMRTNALPTPPHSFDWTHLREQIETERAHREAVTSAAVTAANDNEPDSLDSVNADGSDIRNKGIQDIERAPPVRLDTEELDREEAVLQAEKDALVRTCTPVFFANNPGFRVTTDSPNNGNMVRNDAFVCQKASMSQANLNAHLTDPLEELTEFLHVERDVWREYMYKKVVTNLKALRVRVASVRDLKALPWLKGRMRAKLVEVLDTGQIEKLEAKRANPRLRSLVTLARIWGVGPVTAAKLYNMGLKTLDDLRACGADVLTEQQQIGLKHYDDFLTKIPRAEVAQIEETVVNEVHALLPNATALSCGSYRRGKPFSGDCDVLVTDPDNDECMVLPELLERLRARGFITDDLMHVTGHHVGECDTYMGVCRVAKDLPHRRLDIKVYPRRCFGFAILYFTGSDHFNRSMRLLANKKGWTLSDRALRPVTRVHGAKLAASASVVCSSEVDVFIALGMEYKDPRERNCFDIRFLDEDEAAARGKRPPATVSESVGDAAAVELRTSES